MTKTKLLTIAVIGLLVVNLGTIGFLLLRPGGMPQGSAPGELREGPRKVIIKRLHFDAQQVAAYEKLIDQHQASIRAIEAAIKETKQQLYTTLAADTAAATDSLVTQLGNLQMKIEATHYQHFADIKKICKPAQLNDFKALTKDLVILFTRGRKSAAPPKD